ncbi:MULTISPECIES: ABC transporter substrate-binding protein [unclassified Crossiella]|uniref:ABC transporter substrate-binding protein n=1 Tax=unclassified Crossiella TaxID=2620835 RepID=UPI001FFEF9B5|nr:MULTISPECIES: extracellular solute-binding protein [unclassified Crossiella]MCK2242685.1 extracellular solute-binding protein [Crossiella sp. S99.2]MCK2256562.1 extracellular solute-binding protein [Crossiella sp. S99.1]
MILSKKARRGLSVLLAAGLGLTVAACGSGGAGGDGKALTYWSMWKENEPQAQVLKEAAAAFKASSGIEVKIEWQGRDVLKKVVPALRSGELPDLVDQDENTVRANLVTNNAQRDLTGLYGSATPAGAKVSEVVPDRYLTNAKKDGKLFMLPYTLLGFGLFYNGATLPEVAGKPPTQWNDFTQLLAKRKGEGASPLALDGDIGDYNAYWTIALLQGLLGPGKVNELAKDRAGTGWNTPAVKNAVGEIRKLAQAGYFIPGYDGSKFPAVQEKWAQGEADFVNCGSWIPSEVGKKAKPGFQFKFMPMPSLSGKVNVPASTIGFAIPQRAKNPENAEKFIAFFLGDEHLGKISSVAKNLTPNAKLPAPPELAEVGKALAENDLARPLDGVDADFVNYNVEVFNPANDQLIKGKIDVDQFLTQLATAQVNYWKKNG